MTDAYLEEFVTIAASGVLDVAWYRRVHPDVADAGMDPLEHFIRFGWHEGRDPSPTFSVRYYLDRYDDVRATGTNPLLHYLRDGWREGRQPAPGFDPHQYLARSPELQGLSVCPLVHLLATRPPEDAAVAAAMPSSSR